jgi:hypothetical protein
VPEKAGWPREEGMGSIFAYKKPSTAVDQMGDIELQFLKKE